MTNYSQKMLRKLYRFSDMALNPGETDYGNRQGLRWHRFVPGQFQGETSLPEEASGTIQNMMERFKQQFGEFRMNPQTEQMITKFRGMIFVIYAHDTAVPAGVESSLPNDLAETANFVREHHVRMIPNGTDKSIGTDFWITHNAHAYAEMFPEGVSQVPKSSPESIVPLKSEGQLSAAESNGIPYGNLIISDTSKGYGLFLDWEGTPEPVLRGQSAVNTEKFFVDNLRIGSSIVSLPQGKNGPVVSARRINLRAGDRNNEQMIEEQKRRLSIYNDAMSNETAYKLNHDEEGGIFATNIFTEEDHYLNQEQVRSIIRPEQLGNPFFVRPAKGQPIQSVRDGQWRMSPELKNHLETTDSPVGFSSLQRLRSVLDEMHENQHGSSMHSPYEGYKIILIGPAFSNAKNLGEGQAQSVPGFATHITSVEPGIQPEGPVTVDRGLQWVVLANEIRPNADQRMQPWTRVQGKSERSASFDNPQDAVSYVTGQYVDLDVPGNNSVLSSTAESLVEADKALRAAMQMPAGMTPQQTAAPLVQDNVAPSPISTQMPPGQNQTADVQSSLRKTLRHIKI